MALDVDINILAPPSPRADIVAVLRADIAQIDNDIDDDIVSPFASVPSSNSLL
uniref:Uncharacterized protein n=1 Tax=Oryza sativa subsp. japonica TaxID=39947 RepID=Q6K2I5_ORYSJ|nr:hypothetical protein [Oryza sativa Japonica Group]